MKQQPSMCSPFILMLSGQKYNDMPYSFGQGRIKYMICTYRDRGAVSVGAHLGQTNDQYFIWIEKEVHYCGPGPLRPAHNASPVHYTYLYTSFIQKYIFTSYVTCLLCLSSFVNLKIGIQILKICICCKSSCQLPPFGKCKKKRLNEQSQQYLLRRPRGILVGVSSQKLPSQREF